MQFIIYGERLDQGASLCCYVLFVLSLFLFVLIMYFLYCGTFCYFLFSDEKKVTKEKSPAFEKLSKIILAVLQEKNSFICFQHLNSNSFSCYVCSYNFFTPIFLRRVGD
jgi:hypothetical protein